MTEMVVFKTPFVTPDQIAEAMDGDCTAATVRQYCRDGLFPGAQRIGEGRRATWTIPLPEAEQFIAKYERYSHTPITIDPAPIPRFTEMED